MNILFVCSSNVGRSQIAEALFNKYAQGKHRASSAGILVNKEGILHEGQTLQEKGVEDILKVLEEVGIDAHQKTRTQLTPDMVERSDMVIMLEKPENVPDYISVRKDVIYWDIQNQTGKSLDSVRETRDRLQILIETLLTDIN